MPKEHLDVFISSTSIDLPEHRQAVINALLGIGLFPSGMEHWPVEDENPVDFCRQKIEEAEIYIGIYAHRYGWRPGGPGTKSITELEYEWATARGIPRYCFIMHDDHPWPRSKMELDAEVDLDAFKARVRQQVVGFFTDPNDLKAQVLQALAKHAQKHDMGVIEPYLRRLHNEAMQSGLLRTLDARTKDPAFQGQQITVDQVYTPLDTRTQVLRDDDGQIEWQADVLAREQRSERETSPLTAMEAANHFPRLVLLGDPGSGKSTFVNFLALGLTGHLLDPRSDWLARLEAQGWEHQALLPVHVTLRDFAQDMGPVEQHGTAQSLLEHIGRQLEACGCGEALRAVKIVLSRDNDALLILDGLDEVPTERRAAVRDAVTDLMAAYSCRVLVTCRILSYTNPEWQIPNTQTLIVTETVTLAPFDRDQIRQFIRAWYTASVSTGSTKPEVAQARITDLSDAVDDVRLRDMASNPMLLTVMAIVHNHRGTLPRETARLYHECVEILMLRWKPDEARHLREELDLPDEIDLYRILWQIAYEAHEQQADREGAADIPKKDVIAIAAENHLRGDYGKAQRFCDYVEERAGLLIGRGGDDHQRRVYAFPHRTFQEYLAGCHIADDVDFADIIDEKARAGANWRQVVLLSAGHMYFNKTDRNQPLLAVQYILRDDPRTEDDWRAVMAAGEILLLIGLPALENHKLGVDLLPLARQRLVALVSGGHLEPVERAAAGQTLGWLGDPRPGVLAPGGVPDIDWVEIPAGEFLMGSDKDKDPWAYDNEMPQQTVYLDSFTISRYPITFAQYAAFVEDEGYQNSSYWTEAGWKWKGDKEHPEAYWNDPEWHIANHPVVGVRWYEAYAFTQWLSAKLDVEISLPTEAQWERAARGTDGRIYPHGNMLDAGKGNTSETGIGRTSAVGLFPEGASPEGVLDMIGNVFEWSMTKWRASYSESEDNDPSGTRGRVVRGGSWLDDQVNARCAYRFRLDPGNRFDSIGFRLVRVPHL
ncbi:MAG: SUMF1/EgtB/PvdO family nonheme iron enzyme [Chloroflexi bacterium]|nr:SUMF1/EgtB/PvdO family nonheme iron enzyme [Chloroflexota bacterium]